MLLAQRGHDDRLNRCPLSGAKRTSTGADPMSAFDPKPTFRLQILTWIKFRVVAHELSSTGTASCSVFVGVKRCQMLFPEPVLH